MKSYSKSVCLGLAALVAAGLSLVGSACGAEDGDDANQPKQGEDNDLLPGLEVVNAFPELSFVYPLCLQAAPGDGELKRLFVADRGGEIHCFKEDAETSEKHLVLDLSDTIHRGHNEEGLLALALHPEFQDNGYFYVCYSQDEPRRGRVSRFTIPEDERSKPGPKADVDSERVIIEVEKPLLGRSRPGNHNGCCLLFGPDGYLYASFGDGGAGGDPWNNGQDRTNLLGTIIRIDVDVDDEAETAYAIPEDNPFVGDEDEDVRGEIWAWGLRNVWRMSFDRETGELWAGDVGQNKWEEIDLITKGGNYGWRIYEGTHVFDQKAADAEDAPDDVIDPIVEYDHDLGVSVTGGYVYRGPSLGALTGAYVYADYGTRRVWGLRYEGGELKTNEGLCLAPGYVTSFGEGHEGELYLCMTSAPRSAMIGKFQQPEAEAED